LNGTVVLRAEAKVDAFVLRDVSRRSCGSSIDVGRF